MSKLDKLLSKLTADTVQEMQAASLDEVKGIIVAAEQAIAKAKAELENSLPYQKAKEDVAALSLGYRDLKKYQSAKIQYALILLEGNSHEE